MFEEYPNEHSLHSVTNKQFEPLKLRLKAKYNLSVPSTAESIGVAKSKTQYIDDLTTQLSRTRIDSTPSTEEPPKGTTPQTKDAIDRIIRDVLTRDLKSSGSEKLLPSHPCFDLARRYAIRWHISEKAVDSHIKLACGYLKFPVILLLNPAPKHERLPFGKMVKECVTLNWIERVLYGVGLELADVMILDACTMLSNDRIQELDKERKYQALSEAYDVTQQMLEMIKPKIIISCQCSTKFSGWSPAGHAVAQELCSSIKSAKAREVKEVNINKLKINVVQAYHPSGFLNRKGHHDRLGAKLEELLQSIYTPCANWKSQHIMALLATVSNTIDTPVHAFLARKLEDKQSRSKAAEKKSTGVKPPITRRSVN